jgi:hypothetical protein
LGLNGMTVGGKRRITIDRSMVHQSEDRCRSRSCMPFGRI